MVTLPAVAIGAIEKEILQMSKLAKENIDYSMDMLLNGKDHTTAFVKNEKRINFVNKMATGFLTKLMGEEMSEKEEKKVGSFYHVVSDVERVGDYCENIVEYSQKLRQEDMSLSEGAKAELSDLKDKIVKLFDLAMLAFENREQRLLVEIDKIEQSIDDMSVQLEKEHIERLKKNACTAQVGSVYLQTVSNLERIADHITNVAFSISPNSKH